MTWANRATAFRVLDRLHQAGILRRPGRTR